MGRSQCTISVLPLVWFQNKQESLRSSGKKEEIDKKRSTFFWEQRKLGDIYTERNEPGNANLPILSVSIHSGVSDGELSEDDLGKNVRRSEDKTTYKHVYDGDLIFNMMRAWQGAIGVAKGEGMISPAYISAIPNDEVYPPFMDFLLKRADIINQINNLSYGVTDFRKRLYWDSFVRVKCMLPSVDEQKKIANTFIKLDRAIALHQSKAKLWNFVRFSRSPISWEQRKLAELATFSKGTGYSKSDLKESGTPIILYGRLYTKYETTIKDVDTFAEPKNGSTYSASGEVIVPASGETAEDISIASVVEKPGVLLGGDLNIIHPNYNIDPTFLAISVSNGEPHMDMARRAQGKSVVHLHNEDLAQIELRYPSITEQKKIGKYFNGIDHLITLHQRKKRYIEYYRNRGIFYAWI